MPVKILPGKLLIAGPRPLRDTKIINAVLYCLGGAKAMRSFFRAYDIEGYQEHPSWTIILLLVPGDLVVVRLGDYITGVIHILTKNCQQLIPSPSGRVAFIRIRAPALSDP